MGSITNKLIAQPNQHTFTIIPSYHSFNYFSKFYKSIVTIIIFPNFVYFVLMMGEHNICNIMCFQFFHIIRN